MLKRTITGAVILLITVLFVALRHFSALIFDAYALIISYCCLYEMLKARKLSGSNASAVPLFFVPALACVIFVFESSFVKIVAYFLALALGVLIYALTEDIIILAKKRKEGTNEKNLTVLNHSLFERTKNTMQTLAYPLLPLIALFGINHLGYGIGFMGIILVFAVSMLTDTVAYFFGVAFGKRKFVPEVSPNKTIAGMIGGFVGGIIGATTCFCAFYFTNVFGLADYPLALSISAFAVIAVVGSFINQLGDLVESAFKRRVGIKDSSNVFPGHGGFLDRVDGQMFTAVLIYAIFLIFLV